MSHARPQLVFVDGTFAELIQDVADYLHVSDEVKQLLKNDQQEDALMEVVVASAALNSVPEKEFTAANNLIIHLVVNESEDPRKYLPIICQRLQRPITSSPVNGAGLALNGLQTAFNLLEPSNSLRFNVFMEILKFTRAHSMYDNLKSALPNLPRWLQDWETDGRVQRQVFTEVADIALEAGEEE